MNVTDEITYDKNINIHLKLEMNYYELQVNIVDLFFELERPPMMPIQKFQNVRFEIYQFLKKFHLKITR